MWNDFIDNIPRGGGKTTDVGSSSTSASNDGENSQLQGRLLLCLVALLYGTLNVSLRLIYQLPDPPSVAVLSATRGWLATGCFVPLLAFDQKKKEKETTEDNNQTASVGTRSSFWMAGLELAIWNFLAQGLLNIGLLSTGSARASFLTQTSVVMTPLISFVSGQVVPWTVWVGCTIALGGLTLLSGGGGSDVAATAAGSSMLSFSQGDWWVLGGALSWSFYLFRLSKISSKFQEIPLQATKTLLLAVLYSIWVVGSPGGISSIIGASWTTNIVAWLTLLYSALGPGTIADVVQQQGQKYVSASEANVLLSMEPVFAAICAWLLLGEISTTKELIGGGFILIAALVATTSPSSSSSSPNTESESKS